MADSRSQPVKMVFAARRRDGLSLEEFADYWLNVHSVLARKVPGYRRYVVNIARSDRDRAARPFDGTAEVVFESEAAFRGAGSTPEVDAVMADEPNLFDMESIVRFVVHEHILVNDADA